MKRLCFLSPDLDHARKAVSDLKNAGIPEKHIYALAKYGTDMDDLPDAGPESNDFLPAYKRGLELGGTAGVLAGLTALAFPPSGIVVGGGLVVLLGLYGAGLGGLLTGLAGASLESSKLKKFESEIDRGKILLMVDVSGDDIQRTESLIRTQDPEISIEGIEPAEKLIP